MPKSTNFEPPKDTICTMPKVGRVGQFRKTAAAATAKVAPSSGSSADAANASTVHDETKATPIHDDSHRHRNVSKDKADNKVKEEETPFSRGQRRRQAKREQYLRKEQMILKTLQLKKQQDQKKRRDGLDALTEALVDTMKDPTKSNSQQPSHDEPDAPKTNKAKQRLVAQGLNQMSLVLQHPAFQTNPFEALQEHL